MQLPGEWHVWIKRASFGGFFWSILRWAHSTGQLKQDCLMPLQISLDTRAVFCCWPWQITLPVWDGRSLYPKSRHYRKRPSRLSRRKFRMVDWFRRYSSVTVTQAVHTGWTQPVDLFHLAPQYLKMFFMPSSLPQSNHSLLILSPHGPFIHITFLPLDVSDL